jgi:hypothetical protein
MSFLDEEFTVPELFWPSRLTCLHMSGLSLSLRDCHVAQKLVLENGKDIDRNRNIK